MDLKSGVREHSGTAIINIVFVGLLCNFGSQWV